MTARAVGIVWIRRSPIPSFIQDTTLCRQFPVTVKNKFQKIAVDNSHYFLPHTPPVGRGILSGMSDVSLSGLNLRETSATAETNEESAERLPIAQVPLAELEGLPLFEQFLLVWGTPERGLYLWQQWYDTQPEMSKAGMETLLAQTVEASGWDEDEAKRRLAVEKYLNDRGGAAFAAKFLDGYRARQFSASRTLQPMAIKSRKKR
jgi:hypothetical protein